VAAGPDDAAAHRGGTDALPQLRPRQRPVRRQRLLHSPNPPLGGVRRHTLLHQPPGRVEGQALVHVLFRASLSGLVVRGPMVGSEHAFVLIRDWLGHAPPVDREQALAELARRYLAGHGPASDRDLARWANLPLRDVRLGLGAISDEVDTGEDGLLDLRGRPEAEPAPPRLLGAFDPLLLGWVSRGPVVGRYQGIVTSNGIFRPFALVEGRAVGLWSLVRGRPVLAPFDALPGEVEDALQADALDVQRFLGTG